MIVGTVECFVFTSLTPLAFWALVNVVANLQNRLLIIINNVSLKSSLTVHLVSQSFVCYQMFYIDGKSCGKGSFTLT